MKINCNNVTIIYNIIIIIYNNNMVILANGKENIL